MDPTDEDQEARRERLRSWLADHGGHARVVEARSLKPSYASFVSQVCNGYSFGARAARTMEQRLGMPHRWLDGTTNAISPLGQAASPPPLEEALRVVVEKLPGLSPYTASKVFNALQAATKPDAPIEEILRDLLQLLGEPRVATAGKRQASG